MIVRNCDIEDSIRAGDYSSPSEYASPLSNSEEIFSQSVFAVIVNHILASLFKVATLLNFVVPSTLEDHANTLLKPEIVGYFKAMATHSICARNCDVL